MPADTDEDIDLRRASLDSDSSIFSHFSLTPESEATLRAWEQAMLDTSTTTPTPTPSNPTKGSGKSTSRRWVVFFGRNPGIYNTFESAREQTTGIPNALSLVYSDITSAERDFERFSSDGSIPPYGSGPWVVFAGRTTGVFTELGAVKASVDGYPANNFMACPSVAAATEVYRAFMSLPPKGVDPSVKSMTTPTGQTPSTTNAPDTSPDTSPEPTASGSRDNGRGRRDSLPRQPFSLDESISELTGHECYWVTWAAVRPGVFFGMDALMAAQPMAGGYAAIEDQDEGFKLFHILVQARLIRKLRVPPS